MSPSSRYHQSMIISKGISFTEDPPLFEALQNRGKELLLSVSRRLMRSYRFPFALLITCDRAEVIAQADGPIEVLERALGLNPAKVREYRYSYEGEEALLRLFMLSAGVLSPLFGEDTIQGQITASAEAAALSGTISPELRKLLSSAVAFSKRIHTAMNTRVFDQTIAEEVSRRLKGLGPVLIIGSGEGARITAEHLIPEHTVTITLRDDSKTFLIPHGALHVPYERRREMIASSDAVVSASSGLYHTLDDSDLPLVQGKMLFDLSSPPDLPPSVGAWTVSSLGVPLPERDAVIETVKREAEDAVAEYMSWLERAGIAEGVMESAERISLSALRRSSDAITSLQLDPEKEKAFREALSESIRKASVSELIVRKS